MKTFRLENQIITDGDEPDKEDFYGFDKVIERIYLTPLKHLGNPVFAHEVTRIWNIEGTSYNHVAWMLSNNGKPVVGNLYDWVFHLSSSLKDTMESMESMHIHGLIKW